MSRWFVSGRDRSDSEESESSEEEKKPQQPVAQQQTAAQKKKKFMMGFESEESEEEKRIVKTAQDKKSEVLNKILDKLKNHLKNNDFTEVQDDFDNLCEEILKNKDHKDHELFFVPGQDQVLRNLIVRQFVRIEDSIAEIQEKIKEKKANLNKPNAQALNKIKQKIKKYLQTNGPLANTYEQQVGVFRQNPIWTEDEKKQLKAQDQPKTEVNKPSIQPNQQNQDGEEDDEEEESEYDDEEEEAGDEEEKKEEEEGANVEVFVIPRKELTQKQRRIRRFKWYKQECLPTWFVTKFNITVRAPTKKQDEDETSQTSDKPSQPTEPNSIKEIVKEKDYKLTLIDDVNFKLDYTKGDVVLKKLKDIQDEKRKGKYQPTYHVKLLQHILEQVKDAKLKIEITLNLIDSMFDTSKSQSSGFIARDTWLTIVSHIDSLLQQLGSPQQKDQIKRALEKQQSSISQQAEDPSIDGGIAIVETGADIERSILPTLVNFIERLDHELLKAFQGLSHASILYLQRIKDENQILFLGDKILEFLQEFQDWGKESRVAIIKLDHLYYKNDQLNQKMRNSGNKDIYLLNEDQRNDIESMVQLIQQSGTAKMKLRATLHQIYHHSIHNRFYEARDLLMKTHISEIIHNQDIGIQILYNRTLTQIGMSAFRIGLIEECHDILVDIVQTAKLREVLAQGISKMIDKPAELEKEEQKRQIPFHQHINMQLLDCIYMISAMILEVENIAENQFQVSKKIISKNFKKLIDQYDSKAFYLAPENYRDNIVYAAKQLNKSNWQQAIDHIFQIKLIEKLPDFNNQCFKTILITKFKEVALKAFIFRTLRTYSSFSLEQLSINFEILKQKIVQIISKMVIRGKILGYFDQDNNVFTLEQQSDDIKELQQLSSQYVDRLEQMVDNNEKLLDMIGGGSIYSQKEKSDYYVNRKNQQYYRNNAQQLQQQNQFGKQQQAKIS